MRVAIKVLKPLNNTQKLQLKGEIYAMEILRGCKNIINFLGVFKDPDTGNTALVTEYIDMKDTNFRNLSKEFTPYEMRYYMYQIFEALD